MCFLYRYYIYTQGSSKLHSFHTSVQHELMNNKFTTNKLIFTNDYNITNTDIFILHQPLYTLVPLRQIGVDSEAITMSYTIHTLKQKDKFDTAIYLLCLWVKENSEEIPGFLYFQE